ncbi:hypothetical protein GCM10022232_86110 [Streptomyces plumbiresistens]|uniref:Transposase n=1 Tax=Streptomyces plumbiresistens TaxID=511811 RepID=A0ABP7TJH0_9ACTN
MAGGSSIKSVSTAALLSNTAFITPEHLIQTIWPGMRKIQYRLHLIDECLTGTGLFFAPTT